MKLLILSALFITFGTSIAMAKGPFENFKGTYKIQKEPRIVKNNILHCNWLNLRNITTLVIDTLNGNETAEVVAVTNHAGDTLHTYITFFEYSKPNEQYPRKAYLSGEESSATYTVEKHASGYTWTMKNENSKYSLEILTHTTYKNSKGSCEYYVELEKVN